MDDVLPKPFTKEGLIQILNKHLGHLKKPITPMEAMVPSASQSIQSANQQISTKTHIKEESPSKSPVVNNNWTSPKQIPGVSPIGTASTGDEFIVHQNAGSYNMDTAVMGAVHYQSPSSIQGIGHRHHAPHRRQFSDVAGSDETGHVVKRQQMYLTPAQQQTMGSVQARR